MSRFLEWWQQPFTLARGEALLYGIALTLNIVHWLVYG